MDNEHLDEIQVRTLHQLQMKWATHSLNKMKVSLLLISVMIRIK